MFYITKGLILRETEYKDNDKLLNILTEDMGVITAKARGVKRKNSPLRSGCQLLGYSEFTLFEKNGFYTVNEAEPLQLFMGLRSDIELLSLGSYFAQVLEAVAAEDHNNPELLSLGLNCLYALDKKMRPQELVKAVFELRVLMLSGYTPELEGCSACGTPDARRFYYLEGGLLCDSCRQISAAGNFRTLSDGVLDAMRYILECEKNRMFSFSLPDKLMKELSDVTEEYLICQLDQSFSSLNFYKRLFITI